MKTHKVLDLVYGYTAFEGTETECHQYLEFYSDYFSYKIVPIVEPLKNK